MGSEMCIRDRTDSAFMHLSSALNVRTYGLFGDTPTNYSEYSNLIKPIIPKGYNSITHGSNAMKKIKPEDVFITIKNNLFYFSLFIFNTPINAS